MLKCLGIAEACHLELKAEADSVATGHQVCTDRDGGKRQRKECNWVI